MTTMDPSSPGHQRQRAEAHAHARISIPASRSRVCNRRARISNPATRSLPAPRLDRAALGELIGNAIAEKFGYTTPVFLRTAAEMARVAGENPFLTARSEDPAFLHVTFLSAPLTPEARASLIAPAGIPDEMKPGLEEVYLFCPQGYGRTKLNNAVF